MSKIPKEDKYGDNDTYEAFFDNYLYFPIASKLVDPLYNLGFTPNMVTLISTLLTISTIYFIHISDFTTAAIIYSIGYLFDSVDGRIARKYNMGSQMGMVYDLVSDNITNLLILFYFLIYYQLNSATILMMFVFFILSVLLLISYGINEAEDSYKKTKSDDFYERRVKEFKDLDKDKNIIQKILIKLFLIVTKSSRDIYKKYFPVYNEECIHSRLKIMKHFGPGNFCLFASVIIYYSQYFLVRR